jgi:glycerol-3-phosphate acyltransferase PlsY
MLFLIGSAICLLSYFIGSIPTGYLVGRSRGIDIRQHGSGNIGATNIFRTLGKKFGIFVFVSDALKGLASVRVALAISEHFPQAGILGPIAGIVAAICCILGHNFTCWLQFKGGKGIATSAGVLIGLMPLVCLVLLALWTLVFYASGYVSLASVAVSIGLPIVVAALHFAGLMDGWPYYFYFALLVGSIAVWRHRSNIQRLLNGTESSFRKKKKEQA